MKHEHYTPWYDTFDPQGEEQLILGHNVVIIKNVTDEELRRILAIVQPKRKRRGQ